MGLTEEERRRVLEETAAQIRVCTRCRLHEGRTHAVPGEGPLGADVLLVGEAPGREEDAAARPFVGSAGRVLDKALRAAKLSRDDAFVTNVVKCRPPANRAPKADEIEACRPYLVTQIATVRPKVVVTLGSTALRAVAGPGLDLKDARANPAQFEDAVLMPTYHPAAVLYNRRLERALVEDLRKAARRGRARAARIRTAQPRKGRPTRQTSSSGAVVADAEGRILLLRREIEQTWALPKGTVEEGESLEETALREVQEETGLRVKLLEPLMEIRYSFFWPPDGTNYDKRVAYFLAEPTGGRLRPESGFAEGRWVSRAEALRLLRWKNDRDVVSRAFERIAATGS